MKTKLIAEIGWNHMGEINLAKEMIDADNDIAKLIKNRE